MMYVPCVVYNLLLRPTNAQYINNNICIVNSMWPGVDSASKNEYLVKPWSKGGRCVRLTTYHLHVPMSRNMGTLTSWKPVGLFRPLMGQLYLYLYCKVPLHVSMYLRHFQGSLTVMYALKSQIGIAPTKHFQILSIVCTVHQLNTQCTAVITIWYILRLLKIIVYCLYVTSPV
jgi:hypothetical protein